MSEPSTPTSPSLSTASGSSVATSPIGAKEEDVLQTFFLFLSQFAFDKAKEQMDKEKEMHKPSFGSSWALMVHSLSQFSVAEKTYMSLGFLQQKRFGRAKEMFQTLKNSYNALLGELRQIEDSVKQQEQMEYGLPGPQIEFELLLSHLCGQLCEYIIARQKTMDFYEQVTTMGTNKNMNYEDLINVISDIIQVHSKNFHHPILVSLKSSFMYECDVINHLLTSQVLMSQAQFLETLLQLHQAHSKLSSWGASAQTRETVKKGMFGSSTKTVSSWPPLYLWLLRYKGLLVAKFSLYFYDILSQQTTPLDMKTLSGKNVEDYHAKITAFQKKTDALNVSLVLDTQGLDHVYTGPGYHYPDSQVEAPKGLDSFPAIYSYPGDYPSNHWPNVVMMLSRTDRPIDTDKVCCIFDKGVTSTYFITCVDVKIYIVVIYECKKSEKDSYVNNFMLELSSMLRCVKHFASLKPGSWVGGSRK
ncbi:hypothetical protein ACF0H5_023129 [Mactra antiquata]